MIDHFQLNDLRIYIVSFPVLNSYTFEKVQDNSEKVWRYYRYGLIYEYFDRPTLAPPLIIISHIWRISKYIYRSCKHITKLSHDFRK